MTTIQQTGEDGAIQRMIAGLSTSDSVICGPGDDCAVVDTGADQLQLLKTDAVVEGIHFLPNEQPERVGWKAIARVVSDFAAMGGWSQHFVITIAISGQREVSWLEGLYAGLEKCAREFGGVIVGGETTSLPDDAPTVISVAGTGAVERGAWVSRSTASPGDVICVTGALGGSIKGKHLDFLPRAQEGRWLAQSGKVSAMMDLSDGLAKDLPRLAGLSGCGYEIFAKDVPLTPGCDLNAALGDGEDYELLVTLKDRSALENWPFELPLTVIGQMSDPSVKLMPGSGGWDHFSQ